MFRDIKNSFIKKIWKTRNSDGMEYKRYPKCQKCQRQRQQRRIFRDFIRAIRAIKNIKSQRTGNDHNQPMKKMAVDLNLKQRKTRRRKYHGKRQEKKDQCFYYCF